VNETLRRLDVLVGQWRAEAAVDGVPVGRNRTTFTWVEGGAFLRMYAEAEPPLPTTPPGWVEHSPFPVTALLGLDDQGDTFTMLYADGRGVLRVYHTTLVGRIWTMSRAAPGFHQRFTGTVSEDGRTIAGRWEASPDGSTWATDFELTYSRNGV
jgi:hypothetical protein